jgi:hypothetical protein
VSKDRRACLYLNSVFLKKMKRKLGVCQKRQHYSCCELFVFLRNIKVAPATSRHVQGAVRNLPSQRFIGSFGVIVLIGLSDFLSIHPEETKVKPLKRTPYLSKHSLLTVWMLTQYSPSVKMIWFIFTTECIQKAHKK